MAIKPLPCNRLQPNQGYPQQRPNNSSSESDNLTDLVTFSLMLRPVPKAETQSQKRAEQGNGWAERSRLFVTLPV